ncbi:MAG: ATP-dependent helicase C-terminal domain-containing protein [Acidobacteriota bacterium]
MRDALPIDAFLPRIVADLRQTRALVITAQPGAGKTTRVPPALLDAGPLILLQPRRVATRAIAHRIADERGWTIGREIGWQMRFERRFSDATRLLVATEGVLSARLQNDPLLSDFRTIVIDEFHERSVHADLAIALAKQAWLARDDLRLVVMSATLDAAAVSSFLDGCPIVHVPGRLFPLDIQYRSADSPATAVVDAFATSTGDVLCFLPGADEIQRAIAELRTRLNSNLVEVVPLHGSLDAAEQDLALRPTTSRRRIVVATNIAETSVTVPRVSVVVDSGLHKIARYDAARGIDSLDVERIPADAADQRAGRAGRLSSGIVVRLWDPRDRLRPHREPEIHRVDLCGPLLDVIAWGGNPHRFDWFERPRRDALDAALTLLERLRAIEDGRLTRLGERIRRLPIHPRLARMLIAAGGSREVARACALLSERHFIRPRVASTTSDLLSAIDDWPTVPAHVHAVARELEAIARRASVQSNALTDGGSSTASRAESTANSQERSFEVAGVPEESDGAFRRAILAGYPDRVAQRREPGSPRLRLASGAGAVLGPESGVHKGEFLVAIDVQSTGIGARPNAAKGQPPPPNDARIRVASAVERTWLTPTHSQLVHRFDRASGLVRAWTVDRYDALTLVEHPTTADPDLNARLLAEAWLERGPRPDDEQLLRRLRFAGRTTTTEQLLDTAARLAKRLDDLHLAGGLSPDIVRALEREAPHSLLVPSGRSVRLDYSEDGSPGAAVKLQELFGLAETPCVGARRVPVVLSLLAPNGRPVQVTRDLRSFWERTYPEVRKELRARYPRHPWPEDPWKATPTARPSPRR